MGIIRHSNVINALRVLFLCALLASASCAPRQARHVVTSPTNDWGYVQIDAQRYIIIAHNPQALVKAKLELCKVCIEEPLFGVIVTVPGGGGTGGANLSVRVP